MLPEYFINNVNCLTSVNIYGETVIDNSLNVSVSLIVGQSSVNAAVLYVNEKVGINTETPNVELTVNGSISSNSVIYDKVGNSTEWNSVYTSYNKNSATYATQNYVQNNFLALTGGTVTGDTQFNKNVTIWGVLSATGGTYFANTIYSTTSALSVIHVGSGPALYVGSKGTGDIASFYDLDDNVEMLHIGGHDGDYPNVGIKTSTPNVDFTVNGEISSSEIIYDANGNSNQWNSAYSNQINYLPLSGGIVNNNLSVFGNISASGLIYGDGSNLTGIVAGDSVATTLVRTNSANWDSVYSSVNPVSSKWDSVYTSVKDTSANWDSVYTSVKNTSANWDSVYSSVSALSGYWVNFQPNPDYPLPEDQSNALDQNGDIYQKNSPTSYSKEFYALLFDNSIQKWVLNFDDNEGGFGQVAIATTTGGTYPWSVSYTNGWSFTRYQSPRLKGSSLASNALEGVSIYAARADHVHPYPSALNIGAAPIVGNKVPSQYLPSYVDDVLEYSSLQTLQVDTINGRESGKIYVVLNSGKIYRWSGSVHVEISNSLELQDLNLPDSQVSVIVSASILPIVGVYNNRFEYSNNDSHSVSYTGNRWSLTEGTNTSEPGYYVAAIGNELYPWLADWSSTGYPPVLRNGTYDPLKPEPLGNESSSGTSIKAAREDHVHPLPYSIFLPLSGGNINGNLSVLSSFEVGFGSAVLFVSGSVVGINTNTPNEALTVVGNISATQNYFSGSNKSVVTPQTNTVGVSAISNIVAVSVLPATPDPSTLYIVI